MSFNDKYLKLRKERLGVSDVKGTSFDKAYAKLKAERFDEEEEEDIAPVRELTLGDVVKAEKKLMGKEVEDEDDGRMWFQKGAFEDGYQFGDITKTIFGSDDDLANNVTAGLLGIGEDVVDTGASIVGGVAGLFGNDKVKDKMSDFIEKDLYDEHEKAKQMNSMRPTAIVRKLLGVDAEEDSVFGEKTDDLAYSAGQLAGTVGLQSVGVPWYVTTGATSFGGAMEGALREGATFEEAAASSAISAGAEMLSEKLFGGSGLGETGLINLDGLTKGISNKAVKTMIDYGIDMAAESAEEIFSDFVSTLGQQLTYEKEATWDELLNNEEAMDSYIKQVADSLFGEEARERYREAAVGGAVLGGGMNVGNVTSSIQSGKDYRSGLTANEEAVVNKVYEDRIAEAAENGETLTAKDKDKIYEEVVDDLNMGFISVEDIEGALGGDTYMEYKNTMDEESELQREFDELGNLKKSEFTAKQDDRYNELKQKLAEIKESGKSAQLKAKLGEDVFGLAQGSLLENSYNERANRGRAFDADLNQYDAKQQEIVKKAIDSGILNNSNRTHQFVDIVAKISADKGVSFDFVNNAKLKESGFALDGKVVNGFVTKDGISINIDSPKAWQSTVGHEITHVLEGTELYAELQNSLLEYAETKGDLQGRRDALAALYDGVEGADVDAELTADLVGDYLFTDSDFINNLSTQHRNVFQKVYDEIKYLCRVATAGSKEARQLEKVRHAFENAYRESGEASGETKYSLSETSDGRFAAVVDNDILSKIDTSTWDNATKEAAKKAASDALKQFSGGIVVDGITRKVNRVSRKEYTRSQYTEQLYRNDPNVFADKMRAADVADDIVVAATNWSRDGGLNHERNDNFVDFDHGETLIIAGDTKYRAEVVVGITNTGEAVFYDVVDMTPTDFDIKKSESSTTATTQNAIGDIHEDSVSDIVPQSGKNVNRKLSISSDTNGRQLSEGQKQKFRDSKVVDENGNLKVMYHGTPSGDFTVFKDGTYFTENKAYADLYQNPGASSISTGKVVKNPKTFEVYLDIKKPFDLNDAEARNVYINDYIKGGNAVGINPYLSDAEYDKITSIDWTEGEDLRDFLVDNGYDYDGLVLDEGATGGYGDDVNYRGKSYVVFSPDQVKNVDNLNPTNDPDIRYSLSSDSDGKTLSKEQQDYFKDSKVRDENGNLKVMYHGSQDAGFHVFDPSMSDDDTSLFFVDRNDVAASYSGTTETYEAQTIRTAEDMNKFIESIGVEGYEVVEKDGKFTLLYEGDRVADSNTAQGIYSEFCWYEGVGEGDANYKVYLNLTNPLEVDAKGRPWNKIDAEFSQEVYDKYKSLTAEEKDALVDLAEWEDFRLFNSEIQEARDNELASAYAKMGEDVNIYDLFSVAADSFSEEAMRENARRYLKTRDFAQRAKEQGYDGVIFKNLVDNGGYSNGDEGASTVAIAFDSNQIKSVANEKPTGDNDIRYSLTEYTDEEKKAHNKAVLEHFGRTYKWAETGYVLLDGSKLDLSGKHEGAPGGYRTVDHRDIVDALGSDYGNGDYSGSLIQFMSEGNIRISPESNGINLSVKPTKAQEQALSDFISKHRGEVILDIDDLNGYTVVSVEYPYGTYYTKVLNDIREWFDNGKQPEVSQFAQFRSLSAKGEAHKHRGRFATPARDLRYESPVRENVAPVQNGVQDSVQDVAESDVLPGDFAPIPEDVANGIQDENMASLTDADAPPEAEAPFYGEGEAVTVDDPFEDRDIKDVGNRKVKAYMFENPEVKPFFQAEANVMLGELRNSTKGERFPIIDQQDGYIRGYSGVQRNTSQDIAYLLDECGYTYDEIEKGLRAIIEDNGAENNACSKRIEFLLNDRLLKGNVDFETGMELPPNQEYINLLNEKQITEYNEESFKRFMETADMFAPPASEDIGPVVKKAPSGEVEAPPVHETKDGQMSFFPEAENSEPLTRKRLHASIIDNIKSRFAAKGYDLDRVLKGAKNLSTFATVDNTPQRVMEKALGYKEGQILADETVNKVAQNETEGIKWLNSFTDRKNGFLAQISRQYHIKPGSKESAAAQMYAEGFYVDKNNEIVAYGDAELAADFPDPDVQKNIKGLAGDKRIRQIYDDTLAMINESRTRNAYPEIPRLENYFLHFRAMDDTFSRLGLPFNPNDIRAKDLPTDLNGVTADLKPGQPYFASANHRTGQRTSFDLLGGLERYLTSAKNQIYHIDDIQSLRALRNYIADIYGQANGLDGLDALSEEEAQERIKQVYGSHLSTFAKFLNEEANVLAGKTALIDRGLEGIIGRRGITFLNSLNKQVGSNMVGFNISSSLTNIIPVVQAFAKGNKAAFVKALGQTSLSILGHRDGFVEQSPVMIRRKGADQYHRTLWQKVGDAGYALMGVVDRISTELIARTKYNELTYKGMDSQKAHFETDKWVSRLMGDRSLGQQPQLYNSKMLGMFTKFQLEVRNQLDSQLYDTIQETKVSNEHIENELARNAKTAVKVASVFVQLAVLQHGFGKLFENVAGYNPAFDIIEVLIKTFGLDDDEDDEDTMVDNLWEGANALLEDLPYTSTLTGGGRIPISSALPIKEFLTGKDDYGNEKSRLETLGEVAPYYLMPGGYGQAKKTIQGLGMFSDDHPVSGSYTDSGNLRFPVEDTLGNKVQAGIFGQWASENARDYFDNERKPLEEKQIQEYIDVELPIADYWNYREGLSGLKTLAEKADYIASLDLETWQKNILINNLTDRATPIDMTGYENYSNFEEFDFATRYPEKYAVLQKEGISVADYKKYYEDTAFIHTDDYSWAADNPEKYTLSKAITDDVTEYKKYTSELAALKADYDEDGKVISGSAKEKKKNYIFGLDLDYGQKIILYRSLYSSQEDKNTYNADIVHYLDSREDISLEEMITILEELGMKMENGYVTWD